MLWKSISQMSLQIPRRSSRKEARHQNDVIRHRTVAENCYWYASLVVLKGTKKRSDARRITFVLEPRLPDLNKRMTYVSGFRHICPEYQYIGYEVISWGALISPSGICQFTRLTPLWVAVNCHVIHVKTVIHRNWNYGVICDIFAYKLPHFLPTSTST
jgi:hypothetical protein